MAVNNIKASEDLKAWIRQHEGFLATAYADDWAGTPDKIEKAIGYGHQIQEANGEAWLYTATITRDYAQQLMNADLAVWEKFLNTYLKKKVNQKQADALLNLCYSVGGGGAWPVIKAINEGKSEAEIKKIWGSIGTYWMGKYWPNLAAGRQKEIKMYFSGTPGKSLLMIAAGTLLIIGFFQIAKKI